ncbi:Mu transposase C-terminal domain-containing protein [Defluviimonas salinarum]|uniref:Mu transposase C-terminal domain-containing protein n=1 Tax=Defluviimonas salinarum TaxID=2992147 RepID=A0ABT3J9F7_9RHOB|nr:Mu transposase C-terminal domain-containing protein [Defluviimonas salinarum]MCW3784328.1 Mu transposase C-terminal domain-containing protein [Defluviimonas salinarum]
MDLSFSFENARYAFGKADRVTVEGIPYRVHVETEVGVVFTRDDTTALSAQFSHADLARLGSLGRIRVERDYFDREAARKRQLKSHVSTSALIGRPMRRLTKKDAYCQAALELHHEKLMGLTDTSIAANTQLLVGRVMALASDRMPAGKMKVLKSENLGKPPSPRTLRRWLAERDEFGLVGHLDAMAQRGNRRAQYSPEAVALMRSKVRGYLSRDRPTIKQIHEDVQIAFIERNEERAKKGLTPFNIPSRETVRRLVRDLDPYQVELARNGEAAARKKFRPVLNGISVTRPLERVEIDEWTVDVATLLESTEIYGMLTDDEKRSIGLYIDGDEKTAPKDKPKVKRKDRWTLTAAICCATRCIVGLVLSRKPNAEAAVQVLQMITTNKGAWADAVGALTPWDMHGTPELIVFDGGPAFKSLRFRTAAEDLGIMWEMAMNGVPENRGTIERVLRTFSTDFAPRLSGHTFSSIMEKGDADPEKRAALTLDDFTFALLRWVVDIYHNTPHRGLGGETPVKAWRRLSKHHGVTPPPDSEMMRLCFGQQREYRLDKTGISILGVRYQSDALQAVMRRKAPKKVDVRWHPKDIGAISVRLDKDWYEVSSLDATLGGVSAQTWLTGVRQVRDSSPKSNRLDNIAVREAIKAIAARNQAAMGKAKLNLEDWSDERFEREERELLAGIEFYERKAPTKAAGQLGHDIPTVEDLTGEPMAGGVGAKATSTSKAKATRKPTITIEED